jgi:hypothetical protein
MYKKKITIMSIGAVLITLVIAACVWSQNGLTPEQKEYQKLLSDFEQAGIEENHEEYGASFRFLMEEPIQLNVLLNEVSVPGKNIEHISLLGQILSHRGIKLDEFEKHVDDIAVAIQNKSINVVIRRRLIMETAKWTKTNDYRDTFNPIFLKMLRDADENPNVIYNVIRFFPYMTTEVEEEFFNIVQSWKDIELDRIAILKSACQKLAKLKYEAATPHFIEMISATDDDDVFVSGVLALALTKSPAMIEPLVDNHSRLGQGNSFTVENALEDNVELLLQILKDQTEPLTPTIKAVGIIGEKGALLYLENLLQTRPELQELLAETIQKIK